MHKQIHGFGVSRLMAQWTHGSALLHAMVVGCLRVRQRGLATGAVPVDAAAIARSDELFTQALREDSNRELDWLWYAARITSDAHRRVCLQRALQINPRSEGAKRGLGTLARTERA